MSIKSEIENIDHKEKRFIIVEKNHDVVMCGFRYHLLKIIDESDYKDDRVLGFYSGKKHIVFFIE